MLSIAGLELKISRTFQSFFTGIRKKKGILSYLRGWKRMLTKLITAGSVIKKKEHMIEKENNTPIEIDDATQLSRVFARYGNALYEAQILEQKAINMLVIDDLRISKPEKKEEYDAIWAKYDHSKKMVGVMTNLLQEAYQINEEDINLLRNLISMRNHMANRYFRYNDILFDKVGGLDQMFNDFTDFAQSVSLLNDKLNTYIGMYNQQYGVNEKGIGTLVDAQKEYWKELASHESYNIVDIED